MKLLLATLILTFSVGAFAKKHDAGPMAFEGEQTTPTDMEKYTQDFNTLEERDVKAFEKEGKRSVSAANAADAYWESKMSPEYKDLRSRLQTVNSADDLDAIFVDLEKKLQVYDAHPEEGPKDFKYVAAQLIPLRCMRGIVWRFVPLAAKSKIVQSRLATEMMKVAYTNDIIDVAEQWKVAFQYLVEPYNGVKRFQEASDLQAHLRSSCYGELEKSRYRIGKIKVDANDADHPIIWDRQVFFGRGDFPSKPNEQDGDLNRYKVVGRPDQYFSLAVKDLSMSWISFFRSYQFKGYFALQTALGADYGFDTILPKEIRQIQGVDFKKRSDTLNQHPAVFAKYADGQQYMLESLGHLQVGVRELRDSWRFLGEEKDKDHLIMRPSYFVGFNRGLKDTLDQWMCIVSGPCAVQSKISSTDVVTVDLPGMYRLAPDNLHQLLPAHYDTAVPHFNYKPIFRADTGKQDPGEYRNYYYGKALDWNKNQWSNLFPGLKNENGEYTKTVGHDIQVMADAWGGELFIMPLMTFLR